MLVQAVREFVSDAVSHIGADGVMPRPCLYIAGVPGVGKTACVLEVMRRLLADSESGKLPGFEFAEINALRLPAPQHVYSRLAQILTGARRALCVILQLHSATARVHSSLLLCMPVAQHVSLKVAQICRSVHYMLPN